MDTALGTIASSTRAHGRSTDAITIEIAVTVERTSDIDGGSVASGELSDEKHDSQTSASPV